jgi:hypothetical protein
LTLHPLPYHQQPQAAVVLPADAAPAPVLALALAEVVREAAPLVVVALDVVVQEAALVRRHHPPGSPNRVTCPRILVVVVAAAAALRARTLCPALTVSRYLLMAGLWTPSR